MSDDGFFYFGDETYLDDHDDEDFSPEDDNVNDEPPEENEAIPSFQHLDLRNVLLRFNNQTMLPQNQFFIAPLPDKNQLPNSPFSVEQWDLLRHQCSIHFFLLCRSLQFTSFCASSDAITSGLVALLHTFNMIFKSSVEMSKNLNDLFGEQLFVPVIGNPEKSYILRTDQIIQFLTDTPDGIDTLIDKEFFMDIIHSYPNKNEKPYDLSAQSPWTKEESELLKVAQRRFNNPIDIQRYVMPGRSATMIRQHMQGDIREDSSTVADDRNRTNSSDNDSQKTSSKKKDEDDDDDDIFIVSDNMRFNDSNLAKIPMDSELPNLNPPPPPPA